MCVCVCVCILSLVIRHATHIFCVRHYTCTDVCGLCLYHIFPHYLINGTIFGKKLLNIKCVF
jgi:hypothetical protein